MEDTLTLVLDGTVTLADYAKALDEFQGLVSALTKELGGGTQVDWVVSSLASGSAVTTAQGRGDARVVQGVVGAYEKVGEGLESWQPLQFSPTVQKRALGLVDLINGGIESIRFETARRDALIRKPPTAGDRAATPPAPLGDTVGAIEGVVETLSRRGGLRFTLYDVLFDKAVSCYLAPGYEDIMRDSWGKRAIVFGMVHRDPMTGRPLAVRQVTSVEIVPQRAKGDWRKARGAARLPTGVTSVSAIRAVRDA